MSAKPASRREVSASPISSTENSTPEGDSIERSSEPVEAETCAKPTFWMSRAAHVQPTERNAIALIKLGVHTDRGAWVSNSSDVARLSTPLPTNIQNVMTLMSILRPYLAVTAIWMAKKTAPASVMTSPMLNSTLSSATKPMPAKHSSAAPRL